MKWINCKKRLPPRLIDVLIAYKSIHKSVGFNICIGLYNAGEILGQIGGKFTKIESSKIYWKKLPKAPKK